MIEKSTEVLPLITVALLPFPCKKQMTELSLTLPAAPQPAIQHLTVGLKVKVQAHAVQILAAVQAQAHGLQAAHHHLPTEQVPTHEEFQGNTIHSNKHINL